MAERRTAEALPPIESRSPAGGRLLGPCRAPTRRDVDAAVDGAADVQRLWATLRLQDRARYMARAAQAVIDEFDELLDLISREQGRPRAEVERDGAAAGGRDAAVARRARAAASSPARRSGSRARSIPVKRGRWTYEPLGVVAVLGPAAEPFATPLGDVAVALMAGNGVVLKPSPHAALAGERIARVFARAGLPEGLLRVSTATPTSAARSSRPRSRRCASPAARAPGGSWPRRARARSSAACWTSAAMTRCSCWPTRTSRVRRAEAHGRRSPTRASPAAASAGRSACTRSTTGSWGRSSRSPARCASATRPTRRPRSARSSPPSVSTSSSSSSTTPSPPARHCTAGGR